MNTPEIALVATELTHWDVPAELADDLRHHADQNIKANEARLMAVPHHFTGASVYDSTTAETGRLTHEAEIVKRWIRDIVRGAVRNGTAVPRVPFGRSLLLLGLTGAGKTHLAYGAFRALLVSGVAGRIEFATAANVYARLRPQHGVDSEREFGKLADAAVLFLDDLGAAKSSEWTEEVNTRLLNHRYEHGLRTFITANMEASHIRVQLGDRVASRLAEMYERVVLECGDRRRGAA